MKFPSLFRRKEKFKEPVGRWKEINTKTRRWVPLKFEFLEKLKESDRKKINYSIIGLLGSKGPLTFDQILYNKMHQFELSVVSLWKNPRDEDASREVSDRYGGPGGFDEFMKQIFKLREGEKKGLDLVRKQILWAYLVTCLEKPDDQAEEEADKQSDISDGKIDKMIKEIENTVMEKLNTDIGILLGKDMEIVKMNPTFKFPIVEESSGKFKLREEYRKAYLSGSQ